MDEFTSMRNANTHFWSERTWSHGNVSQLSLWDVEESSSGPQGFVPKPGASVVFFADHTLTIGPGAKVATVLLMRVGDLSKEAAVELATVDGTAEAGYSFKASKQTVCFDAGAASAEFHVELLPSSHCVTHRFFVVHATAVYSNVAMGSSSFTRVRLLPVGLWPPGVQLEDVQDKSRSRLIRLRLVWGFARHLLSRRGRSLWHVLVAIAWIDFHRVVLNTLLLNYALYDFCLTQTQLQVACQRLPAIALAKLVLVCIDRLADHIKFNQAGSMSSTKYLQELLIHRYLQTANDTIELGNFLHMLTDTVPDSITHGYKTVYQLAHCFVTVVLSVFMALLMPFLKGESPSFDTLQPLLWIVVPLQLAFAIGFWMRHPSFDRWATLSRDADIEKHGAMVDLLYCRRYLRAYDTSYPVQHVRHSFDDACSYYLQQRGGFLLYQFDTQWVARYLGELTKVFGILSGGYAALRHEHLHEGQMTLGRFTVFLSLYSIIIDVMYMFLEAWTGILYAGFLVQELCRVLNEPDRWQPRQFEAARISEHPIARGHFSIKLAAADFYMAAAACAKSTATVEVPLGLNYGVRTYSDASSLRQRVCEIIGETRAGLGGQMSCARLLLLKPPVSLATGSVLENLLANAASWVRASDAYALLMLLGIPIPAPDGIKPLHGSCPEALRDRLVQHARNLRPLPSAQPGPFGASSHCEWFQQRCLAADFSVLSPMIKAVDLLQPAEQHLFDLARALLADPEVLVLHDMLNAMPLVLASTAVQVLLLWQRLGGFKGVALALEGAHVAVADGYPSWLTVGGIPRTIFISECTIVCAGLDLDHHLDSWLLIHPGGAMEVQHGTLQ
ncbi:unnamed protein product [Effrenium voratum]|nr:unnamed protein product [Effrenium voratum]